MSSKLISYYTLMVATTAPSLAASFSIVGDCLVILFTNLWLSLTEDKKMG